MSCLLPRSLLIRSPWRSSQKKTLLDVYSSGDESVFLLMKPLGLKVDVVPQNVRGQKTSYSQQPANPLGQNQSTNH